eukprot:gene7994-12459_t
MNYVQQLIEFANTRPPVKYIEPEAAVFLVLISFLFFYWLQFVSKVIFDVFYVPECFKTMKDKMDWHSRIVSCIHAIIATIMATACFKYEYETLFLGNLFGDNQWKELFGITVALTSGYLFADFWVVYQQGDFLMMLHHIGGGVGLFIAIVTQKGAFFTVLFCFTEISTPFMNFRWFLDITGYRNSVIYLINGLIATFLFGFVRILYIISFYYKWYTQWDDYIKNPFFLMMVFGTLANLVHILNIIWFYKIMNGLIKVLCGPSSEKVKKE